jgi:hypothetical protein
MQIKIKMKISELIAKLEEIKSKEGDLSPNHMSIGEVRNRTLHSIITCV